MTTKNRAEKAREHSTYIYTTLAHYPQIEREAVSELIDWFEKEATVADMMHIGRDPELKRAYRRLKSDHIDRLKGVRLFWTASLGMLAAAVAAGFVIGGL